MKRLVARVRQRLTLPAGFQARLRILSGAAAMLLVVWLAVEVVGFFDGPMVWTAAAGGIGGREMAARDERIDEWLAVVGRRPLFKPAIPLPSRPMARESVNRVRDMLSVHGIMERDHERVAYINVKGLGMRSYKVGEEMDELFKVTGIEPRKVEVEISGERLDLEM